MGGAHAQKVVLGLLRDFEEEWPKLGTAAEMAMRARSTVSCRCCSTWCSDSADPAVPDAEPPGAKTKFIHVVRPCSRRIDCALRASFGTSCGNAAAACMLSRDRWLNVGCGVTWGLCDDFSERPVTFVRVSRAERRFGVLSIAGFGREALQKPLRVPSNSGTLCAHAPAVVDLGSL